jgi:3-oxoadipate enol-lactonase
VETRINGRRLYSRAEGRADAPWVVFSHSLATDHRIWDEQAAALAPHYRLLRYDTRGHGRSEAGAGDYSLDDLGDDVIGLMDAHGIARCHFIGTSLGGMTALGLGLRYRERFLSLSVCAANARIPPPARDAFAQRIATVLAGGMAGIVKGNLERWFTPGFLAQDGPAVAKAREMILGTQPRGYAGCAAAIRGLDYLDRLGEIDLPVLVVVGAQDPGTTPAEARQIADGIAGARYVEIDPGAHNANMENPAAFNRALIAFLRTVG